MNVVFDIGGVLIDWNPRHLYRKLIPDEARREWFLTHVCSHTWNLLQDAGRPFAEGIAELTARYPDYAEWIAAYHARWDEMLGGAHEDTVALLRTLRERDVPVYAITNFNAETFARCRRHHPFLHDFDGIVVSGEVRLLKPDPAIYLRLLEGHALRAEECVFIDDVEANVRGAEQVGMHGIHYRSADQLRTALAGYGLLDGR